ncbi:hypothetical protein CL52_02590 [Stutzerimonas balearica DSM 6083]|uniref:Glycosyl transferase family 51 domain-containing protein n=1 Tax=Stutzerimonas balearica DSM 6083 TaxID=1123016 RepID=A0A8D4C5D5_9GAMM|nr:hypothetical protein CL52_02590 [Stutzerimonas balearica DSM 6083]
MLAAEDDNFANHYGVDVTGLMRAAAQLLKSGHIQTGGSTITMQVAKNYFLTSERSFSRKISEILLALQIERELSKNEILELYVNKIYLGHRAYGIEAASQVYYGQSIKDLSLAQLAMIAGLPKARGSCSASQACRPPFRCGSCSASQACRPPFRFPLPAWTPAAPGYPAPELRCRRR